MMSPPLGVYLHIPFCRQRCDFCAFYLEIHRKDRAEAYVRSLIHEIGLSAQQHIAASRPIQSVYLGGGTPTVLAPTQLIAILSEIRTHLTLASDCEITIEAHPSTISEQDHGRIAREKVDHAEDDDRHAEDHEDHQDEAIADIRCAAHNTGVKGGHWAPLCVLYLEMFTSSKR